MRIPLLRDNLFRLARSADQQRLGEDFRLTGMWSNHRYADPF